MLSAECFTQSAKRTCKCQFYHDKVLQWFYDYIYHLSWLDTLGKFSAIFANKDNLRDFLFACLYTNTFLKRCLL